jgi:SAM-dependent methyltransferase
MTFGRRLAVGLAALVVTLVVVAVATPLGRDLLVHLVPMRWSDEPERLAAALGIREGSRVADIGAGSGALAVELATLVGPAGRAYATEMTEEQRTAIAGRASSAGLRNVTVLAAQEQGTNLPDGCCDAIAMRLVLHHVADHARFAADIKRSLVPGGRVGIIDFPPGALPHIADDHGVDPEGVIRTFTAAGFELHSRNADWGGRTYLLVFRSSAVSAGLALEFDGRGSSETHFERRLPGP